MNIFLESHRINLERQLNLSVQLACVVDEESGACSSIGVRYLLDKKIISGLGAIYVYPGTNVTVGHRGLLRLAINVKGENVHTGSTEWNTRAKGANAVSSPSSSFPRDVLATVSMYLVVYCIGSYFNCVGRI